MLIHVYTFQSWRENSIRRYMAMKAKFFGFYRQIERWRSYQCYTYILEYCIAFHMKFYSYLRLHITRAPIYENYMLLSKAYTYRLASPTFPSIITPKGKEVSWKIIQVTALRALQHQREIGSLLFSLRCRKSTLEFVDQTLIVVSLFRTATATYCLQWHQRATTSLITHFSAHIVFTMHRT